jgi:hypothetical protein
VIHPHSFQNTFNSQFSESSESAPGRAQRTLVMSAASTTTLPIEASIEAPKALAVIDKVRRAFGRLPSAVASASSPCRCASQDTVVFPCQRAVAFLWDSKTEILPIESSGPVTAFGSSRCGDGLIAVAAQGENPAVLLVSPKDRSVRQVLHSAASLDVDAVAISG